MITQGGPGTATMTLVYYIYNVDVYKRQHQPRDLGKLQQHASVGHSHLELHVHHRCLRRYLRLPLHPVAFDGSLHEE